MTTTPRRFGGPQPGSGRPRKPDAGTAITVRLSPAQLAYVEEFRLAHGIATRSEALRRIAFPARVVGDDRRGE